jgi:hypothetical protein
MLVNVNQFLDSVKKHATNKSLEKPEWAVWAENAALQFGKELSALIENGKCSFIAKEDGDGSVFLNSACRDLINAAYQDTEKLASGIFPNEKSLGLAIPEEAVKKISLNTDSEILYKYIENNKTDIIISLLFSDASGYALITSSMLPRKLLELSLEKVKRFLTRKEDNKLHILTSLRSKIPNKDSAVTNFIEQLIINSSSCLSGMEHFDDFTYIVLVHLCSIVKNDYNNNLEINADNLFIMQAIWVIEMYNNYFHSLVLKKKEIEAAFAVLEESMNAPPFYFTLNDIIEFKNSKGTALLNIYTMQDLDAYINRAITVNKDGDLPAWLVLQKVFADRVFIRKEHYLPICVQMIDEAKPQVRSAVNKRWKTLLLECKKETAMENDEDFEKLIKKQINTVNPELLLMFEEEKLILIYRELEKKHGTLPPNWQIFGFNRLLPYRDIFGLRRREMVSIIRAGLPFWYKNAFLYAIYKFFLGFKKKKKSVFSEDSDSSSDASDKSLSQLQKSAVLIQNEIVPSGQNPENYLTELELKWGSLRDEKTRQDLVTDVRSLLRDNLKYHIKISKGKPLKRGELRELSTQWIAHNYALTSIRDQESLHQYMELYMMIMLLKGVVSE